jgi:hypothetical protein
VKIKEIRAAATILVLVATLGTIRFGLPFGVSGRRRWRPFGDRRLMSSA